MITETEIPVRYAETDRMGVVYHSNYLIYFEVARTDFLNKIGYPYKRVEDEGYMSPVLDIHVRYGSPLTYGDVAVVRTSVIGLTPVKTTFRCEVFKKGQDLAIEKPCCVGEAIVALVDAQTFKPVSTKRAVPELYKLYQESLVPAE